MAGIASFWLLVWLACVGTVTGANLCEIGNDIVRENCKEGRPREEWDINGWGDPEIQGFGTKFGVAPGEEIVFKVKTVSDKYRVDVYRLGYYNGNGARLIGTARPFVKLPQEQPECFIDQTTLLYDCGNWNPSVKFVMPEEAISGVYVARLVREDDLPPNTEGAGWRTDYSQDRQDPKFARPRPDIVPDDPDELASSYGQQKREHGDENMRHALIEPRASHIYMVVRNLEGKGSDIVFQTSEATWQAYNRYGGTSTYGSYDPTKPRKRCYASSFNRPFENRAYRAINLIFGAEYPAIRFLERNGFDIQYMSGLDVYRFGQEQLLKYKVFLSVGHDEYWSKEQRLNVEAARDKGVHLQFWSGNEVFWQVRWEESKFQEVGTEPRTMICYKETQELKKIDPVSDIWTGTFRDARSINPQGSWPENSLTGQIYVVNAWRHDPLMVPRRFANFPLWAHTKIADIAREPVLRHANEFLFKGTRPLLGQNKSWIEPWLTLKQGLLGHEWDEDLNNGVRPPGMIRMSETNVDNVLYIQDSGSVYDSGSATHRLTLYRANFDDEKCSIGNRALVFGAGTVQWTWGLDPVHDNEHGLLAMEQNNYNTRIGTDLTGPEPAVQQATINMFAMQGVAATTLDHGLVQASLWSSLELHDQSWTKHLSCEVKLDLSDSGIAVLVTVNKQSKVVISGVEIQLDHGVWLPADHDLHSIADWLTQGIHVDPLHGHHWRVQLQKASAMPSSAKCRITNSFLQTSKPFGPFALAL